MAELKTDFRQNPRSSLNHILLVRTKVELSRVPRLTQIDLFQLATAKFQDLIDPLPGELHEG
jgi:hypothetical protein